MKHVPINRILSLGKRDCLSMVESSPQKCSGAHIRHDNMVFMKMSYGTQNRHECRFLDPRKAGLNQSLEATFANYI